MGNLGYLLLSIIVLLLFILGARKCGYRRALTVVILFVGVIGGGVIAWAFVSGAFQ